MSLMALVYFANELIKINTYLGEFYLFGPGELGAYRERTTYFVLALIVSFFGLGFILRYKNWISSTLLIVTTTILIVLCIKHA